MKRRANIIAVSCFLAAVLLIFLINPGSRQRLQSGFLSLISPFLRKGSELDTGLKNYKSGARKLGELEAENSKFKTEAEQLRAENQALRGVESENIRLKKSLGYQAQSSFTLISAHVIGRPITNWWNTIEVDKGTADGLLSDMPVLTADGLVGKVIQIAEHAATVLLITDENCKVAATVEGTKEQGIVRVEVRGERTATNLQPRMTLNFVSKYASLQPGQKVFTSGAGNVYPAGVLIGHVVEFKSRELDGQAVIEPAVDLVALTDVFIKTGIKANVNR